MGLVEQAGPGVAAWLGAAALFGGGRLGSAMEEFDRRELEVLGGILDWNAREEYGRGQFRGKSPGEMLAEKYLKVRGKDGRLRPLVANAAQHAYERTRGAGNIVLKARQMGMTTWIAGRFLLKTITRPGTLTLQVAHTQESAEEILQIVHRFVQHLPEGLRDGVLKTSRQSARQIVFAGIDSEYRVVSAADRNAGRGMTVQNLHCSEVSRWPGDAAETLAGLRASLAIGRGPGYDGVYDASYDKERCAYDTYDMGRALPGRERFVGEQVLESTPNGTGGCFYEEWQRAGEGQGGVQEGLVRHFFPWWMESGYRGRAVEEATLSEEERELMARLGLDVEQIGYRRGRQAEMGALARQEFVEDADSCFLASGDPFFPMEAVEARLKVVPPARTRTSGVRMDVWMPPLVGKTYVVAVDPGGGGASGDWSAIEVLDLETGVQCAEYAAHVTGRELATVISDIAWEYNRAWVVVERNNHGAGVIWLLENSVGYRALYEAPDGQRGWLTTSVSRPAMLARMAAALVEAPGLFLSRNLLVECRSFVRLENGGVGARSGAHDDRVMAMAIGLAARVELLGRPLPAVCRKAG